MVRRTARHLVRWVASVIGVLALVAAFLVWRFESGPVSLDALAPYLSAQLSDATSGLTVRIDHTLLHLGRGAGLEIVARGVHLRRPGNEARLTLSEMSLGLSLREAMSGVIAPTRIVLKALELRLVRESDGSLRLGLGEEIPAASDGAENLLRDLSEAPDQRGALGYLVEVAIRDAALTIEDRALGVSWRAKRADAVLHRGRDGLSGDLAVAVTAPGGAETELHGDFRYVKGEHRAVMQLEVDDLDPSLFAKAAPPLAPLAAAHLPVAGVLRLELDTAQPRVSDAWCDLTLGSGEIALSAFPEGRLAVSGGQLRAAYQPQSGSVAIESLLVDLGGPRLDITGNVNGIGDGLLAGGLPKAADITAELRLSDLPVDDLPRYWPEHLSPNTRRWITEHIHDGIAAETRVRLAAHLDLAADAPQPVRLDLFEGTIAYRNLTVDYFKPLPSLRGVDGSGTFDRAQLDLLPVSGAVKGVQLTGGTVRLFDLNTDDEQIAIDLALRGPLPDTLEVLDAEPLHYAHDLKIDPARTRGVVDGAVHFVLPLKRDLSLAMVDFGAKASLVGVAIDRAVFDRDLDDGKLELRLDRSALHLDGTARLAGTPMTLSWTQSLKAKDAVRTRYAVKARLDGAARQRLGVELLPDLLDGPVDVDVAYAVATSKRATATVQLDLKNATLAIAKLDWRKAPGVPASASFDVELVDERVRNIRHMVIQGGGLSARLDLGLSEVDGFTVLSRAEIARLAVGDTDVSGSVTRRGEGGWRLDLRGSSFDASGLMNDLDRPAGDTRVEPPLVIDAALDRLIIGKGRIASAVRGQLYSDGIHWQALSIDAGLSGAGKVSLRLGQVSGDRGFRLSTDDFGALLRLFDISKNVVGGQLLITGETADQGPRRTFHGTAEGADYRIVGVPLLGRLLSAASLSGFGALLSGEGIPFTRLKSEFTLADRQLSVKELRAYGGAVGVNASGSYDFASDTVDVAGTLVPAYRLNSVLGNIPVLGNLLLGGEGEGIFGVNFRVSGPTSNAQVSVNPLSALAPGFLRKLFLFGSPSSSERSAQPDFAPLR